MTARVEQRRRLRRRLLLASAPIVVLLAFVAVKLVSLNPVHRQTVAGYVAGDRDRTLAWGHRQGWFNVVEQFRSPFAIGDAYVVAGEFDRARPWFEQAFELVPKGGIDDCKVRVNLGLTYERLGDAAKARERTLEWQQFYAKGLKITRERPALCEAPEEGGQTGQQLRDTQQRLERKSQQAPSQPDQGEQPGRQPTPVPQPSPDPDRTPSEGQQEQLREQQKQNTIERDRRQGSRAVPPTEGGNSYPKPW